MDGFTFTAALVEALAWPVATLIIVCLLRPSIEQAMNILAEWLSRRTKHQP